MIKSVPFVDFSRIHQPLKAEMLEQFAAIMDRGDFVLGGAVAEFEKDFAAYCGTKHAVGVATGLDALKLALQAVGVGPGDEVVVPANTFIATAFAVSLAGAKPVLVDVEPETGNMDPKAAAAAVTARTKALLPVHLYGQPATLKPLLEIAKSKNLALLEDVAQAHGALYEGQTVGSFGAAGCFSFYPTKNLGAMGEGGAVTTSDESVKERVQILRNVGQKEKNDHIVIGTNSRLHTVQAAILKVKLKHLKKHTESRQQAAKWYFEGLGDVAELALPKPVAGRDHVYHLFVVTARSPQEREDLKKALGEKGVGTAVHYPTPIHLQKCYASLGYREGQFPVTERLSRQILSLPMFPGMTQDEVGHVVDAIRAFYR